MTKCAGGTFDHIDIIELGLAATRGAVGSSTPSHPAQSDHFQRAARHPAAMASCSLQNQRSPFETLIRVLA